MSWDNQETGRALIIDLFDRSVGSGAAWFVSHSYPFVFPHQLSKRAGISCP